MKMRNGFVSNSSSSSFVLLKSSVSPEFIRAFSEWAEEHNKNACEGYIHETRSAFFGEKNYHIELPAAIEPTFYAEAEMGE